MRQELELTQEIGTEDFYPSLGGILYIYSKAYGVLPLMLASPVEDPLPDIENEVMHYISSVFSSM